MMRRTNTKVVLLLPISIPWGGFQPTLRIFLAPSLMSKEDIDNSQSNYNPDKVVASECSDFLRDLCNKPTSIYVI